MTLVAYVVTGVAGLGYASHAGSVTLLWPPTGIAIAAWLALGRVAAVPVAIGAFTVSAVVTGDLRFAAFALVGNGLEAFVAARTYTRLSGHRNAPESAADAGMFAVSSALGAVAAAVVGTFGVKLTLGATTDPLAVASTWWLGDTLGALLVTPLVLALARGPTTPARALDGLGLAAPLSLVALSALVFLPVHDPRYALGTSLALVVPIVACAMRFGDRGAYVAASYTAAMVVVATHEGRGPLATDDASLEVVLQFLTVSGCAAVSLLLGPLVEERNRALAAVVGARERLEAVFEHAADGLLLLDAERRVLLANPAARRMSGQSFDGDSWKLLSGDASKSLRDSLQRAVERGERYVEARMRRAPSPADEEREFAVRVTVLGGARRFGGAVVIVQDITERERALRERAAIEDHFASAQRLESIGKLAGGIAHDFNNMLQAIQANLELAELAVGRGRDPLPGVSRALDATARASNLTRQLLAFSRRQPASFDVVDVVAVCRSSLAFLERLLPEHLHLVFEPRVAAARVRGDAGQIEQVLMNLVVNARDASPEGGEVRIEIDAERLEGMDASQVRLVVSDQGPGVDPEIRDRIFEPFFTTKPESGGTGLGLAVVYGVVKSHGGAVHVESNTPHGARFVVELPAMDASDAEGADDTSEEVEVIGAGEHVLLVEDDPRVRSAVSDALAASGYRVTVASTGRDAVEAYADARGTIDVVVLDVVMPVMGGREAFERLRAMDPDVAVVFATGYSEEQIDVGFVLREKVPVLTKPYRQRALIRAIADVAAERRRRLGRA